jgi:hypothetical protein
MCAESHNGADQVWRPERRLHALAAVNKSRYAIILGRSVQA